MKFLVCDGDWLMEEGGNAHCSGQLTAMSVEALAQPALTGEERQVLHDYGLYLLVVAFGFLAMKKAIN